MELSNAISKNCPMLSNGKIFGKADQNYMGSRLSMEPTALSGSLEKQKVNVCWLLLVVYSKMSKKGDALKKRLDGLQAKINQNRNFPENFQGDS